MQENRNVVEIAGRQFDEAALESSSERFDAPQPLALDLLEHVGGAGDSSKLPRTTW